MDNLNVELITAPSDSPIVGFSACADIQRLPNGSVLKLGFPIATVPMLEVTQSNGPPCGRPLCFSQSSSGKHTVEIYACVRFRQEKSPHSCPQPSISLRFGYFCFKDREKRWLPRACRSIISGKEWLVLEYFLNVD